MKTEIKTILMATITPFLIASCNQSNNSPIESKPVNYTILLDLSDRILTPNQLEKDFFLIETAFKSFEKQAKKNLILSSKDRFSIKIIPQKNSNLNIANYEDLLHVYFDEIEVKDKNNALKSISKSLPNTLEVLKKAALFSPKSSDYFGVDIWAYLHNNGQNLSKNGYDNTILIITDGYFDFESQAHVIQDKNQYTSTLFLKSLNGANWEKEAETKNYGLMPIKLEKNTKWVVAGVSGKIANDILQTDKIIYTWKKWLKQSGVTANTPQFILNGAKTDMSSILIQNLK